MVASPMETAELWQEKFAGDIAFGAELVSLELQRQIQISVMSGGPRRVMQWAADQMERQNGHVLAAETSSRT